jgi:hypothetical protein
VWLPAPSRLMVWVVQQAGRERLYHGRDSTHLGPGFHKSRSAFRNYSVNSEGALTCPSDGGLYLIGLATRAFVRSKQGWRWPVRLADIIPGNNISCVLRALDSAVVRLRRVGQAARTEAGPCGPTPFLSAGCSHVLLVVSIQARSLGRGGSSSRSDGDTRRRGCTGVAVGNRVAAFVLLALPAIAGASTGGVPLRPNRCLVGFARGSSPHPLLFRHSLLGSSCAR